jgi:hypothetical protein
MISNNVMVPLLSEELDREASDISYGICTTLLTTSGAESEENWCFLANAIQEFSSGEVRYVISDFEFTPSSSSFGMDDSTPCQFSHRINLQDGLFTSRESAHD